MQDEILLLMIKNETIKNKNQTEWNLGGDNTIGKVNNNWLN